MANRRLRTVGEIDDGVGCSIGMKQCAEGVMLGEAMQQADEAMYAAQRAGKNRVAANKEEATSAQKMAG